MSINSVLIDLLFPPLCLSCNSFGEFFCKTCRQKIKANRETICPICLQTTHEGIRHQKCRGIVNGLVSAWEYDGVIQTAIKEVKYRYYYAAFDSLITYNLSFYTKQKQKLFFKFLQSSPIVIPVPLHPKRQRLRGFNQAAIIGKAIAKSWQLRFSDKIIERIINTRPQAELNKQQRLQNMTKVFSPSKYVNKLGDKPLAEITCLVVDDVWTTGTTVTACAQVLRELGCQNIWAFTLAR